jgi:hypothetical protein
MAGCQASEATPAPAVAEATAGEQQNQDDDQQNGEHGAVAFAEWMF